MTVKKLRDNKYKVRVLHFRNYEEIKRGFSLNKKISAKGGLTRIEIDSPNGEHFVGEAKCSKKDNYNKKLGVRIALGRSGVLK